MNWEIYERTRDFCAMRFGMFIHWGLYAIPARGEWVMSNERMTVSQYRKYFDEFNPTDFNAAEWAAVCKRAGMKYAVLTAKHHDGFCLFDSSLTDYKSTNTRFGRDIVREFLDAFRAEGIAVGLYFSLIDWSHPNFPKYADRHHPMRGNEKYRDEKIDFDSYLDFMHGQVKELVTNYGKLDLLWFDFSYDDMCGEKWRAAELVSMVRKYQPTVCLDNRLEGSGEKYGSIETARPLPYSGDFVSPEQIIPPHGIFDEQGARIPWELCATLNDHWGYCESDKNYKSPELIVKKLVECVSKGGNMILNVGPNARGRLPEEAVSVLQSVGDWLSKNGCSIYGCGHSNIEKPEWGRYTEPVNQQENEPFKTVYAHVYEPPLGSLPLFGIPAESLESVRLAATGSELRRGEAWNSVLYRDTPLVSFGANPVCTYALPDKIDTVLELKVRNGN